jgi:hypothetical protein
MTSGISRFPSGEIQTLENPFLKTAVVYDVLAARISALRSKDQGRQNVTPVCRGNGAQQNDPGQPEPPSGGEA